MKDKSYNPIAILKRLTTIQPIRRQYWLLTNEDLSLYLNASTIHQESPVLTPQSTVEKHNLPPQMALRPSMESNESPKPTTEEPIEPKKKFRLKQVVETIMHKKREDEEDEESTDEDKKEDDDTKKFRNFDAVYSMTKDKLKSLRSSPKRPIADEVRRDSEEGDSRRELDDSEEEHLENLELPKQDQELLKRQRDQISQLLEQLNKQSTTMTLLSQTFESVRIPTHVPNIPQDTISGMKERFEKFESMQKEFTLINEQIEKDLLPIHSEADRLAKLISVDFGQRLKGIEDQFYELEKKKESAWLEVSYVLLDYVLRVIGFLIWIYYSVLRLFRKQRIPSKRTPTGPSSMY